MNFDNIPIPEAVKPYAPLIVNAAYGLVIMMAGWVVSKWTFKLVKGALNRGKVDEALTRFLASIAQYIVLAATLIAALNQVGVQTTSLVAILASAGLAVGLALQGSLSNFASGVLILGFRPFVLGDYVELGGKSGTVEDIGLFMTQLVTPNNEIVIVPNSSVTGNTITNFTAKGVRRCVIDIGVAYGEDLRKVTELLENITKGHESCLEDPAPSTVFDSFGASSLNMKVRAYAKNDDFWGMVNELKIQIYEVLNKEGIEIPFDQIVVHTASEE